MYILMSPHCTAGAFVAVAGAIGQPHKHSWGPQAWASGGGLLSVLMELVGLGLWECWLVGAGGMEAVQSAHAPHATRLNAVRICEARSSAAREVAEGGHDHAWRAPFPKHIAASMARVIHGQPLFPNTLSRAWQGSYMASPFFQNTVSSVARVIHALILVTPHPRHA